MAARLLVFLALGLVPLAFAVLPAGYDQLSGDAKREALWQLTKASPYTGILPSSNPGAGSMLTLFRPSFLASTFTIVSDELGDAGREKLIHTHGSVAPVALRINPSSTYTGIFSPNHVSKGLIRLSLARHDDSKFTPGMALKLMIDNHASVNIIAMFSLDGQGTNRNIFANLFWNKIDGPSSIPLKLLAKAFALSLRQLPGGPNDRPEDEENLPLYEHASIDSQGNVPARVVAPYRISFIPNQALGWSPSTSDDFRVHLSRDVPAGSVLYTVAVERTEHSEPEVIGELVTEEGFVASPYGDEQLFFQHHPKRWQP